MGEPGVDSETVARLEALVQRGSHLAHTPPRAEDEPECKKIKFGIVEDFPLDDGSASSDKLHMGHDTVQHVEESSVQPDAPEDYPEILARLEALLQKVPNLAHTPPRAEDEPECKKKKKKFGVVE